MRVELTVDSTLTLKAGTVVEIDDRQLRALKGRYTEAPKTTPSKKAKKGK